MGFTSPVIVNFFMSHITPEYIAICTIVFRLTKVVVSFVRQSIIATYWFSQHFMKIMLVTDFSFLCIALVGEDNPEFRYLAYSMICICGVQLMSAVRRDNINNCLHGSALTIFKARCETWGLISALLGAALLVVVNKFVAPSVTVCMIIECAICAIAHWFQLYANRRIKKLVYNVPRKYSFKDVINDVLNVKRKSNNKRELDKLNSDDILDQ